MSGTVDGGKKAAMTNKKRWGKDYYREIGRKGGSVSTPNGGFAANPALASIAGRKGGKISRRGKAKKKDDVKFIEVWDAENHCFIKRKIKTQKDKWWLKNE